MKMLPVLLFSIVCTGAFAAGSKRVEVTRAPEGGIQPQAATDLTGAVHLIYYKGDSGGGDVFYTRRDPGQNAFSRPLRVNTQPGSAIAAGSIRGAQLAIGKSNRVHVVWNGGKGAIKVKISGKDETPLLYTRMNDRGAFEPERNMLTRSGQLDGGSSVAADANGNVYVVWHGGPPDNQRGEAGRSVYLSRSLDDGRTFAAEEPIAPRPGVCACCGMRAFADTQGAVYVTYRAVEKGLERDEVFLLAPRPGAPFGLISSSGWRAPNCPMSSTTLTPLAKGALAAWESDGQVSFAAIDSAAAKMQTAISPARGAKRKHPVAIANARGETLLAWTEGTAWARGGSVHWQIFDAVGKPLSDMESSPGLPVWGLPTAIARADGAFEIIY